MNRSIVLYSDGTDRIVKNLGWLLNHWKDVESLRVTEPADAADARTYYADAILVADMRRRQNGDGDLRRQPSRYVTPFASREVLWNFLNRPVFAGLTVDWFGRERILKNRASHLDRI